MCSMSLGQPPGPGGTHSVASSYHQIRPPSQVQTNVKTIRIREFVRRKIYEYLMQWHPHSFDFQEKAALEIVKNFEEFLYKDAASEEEYMNHRTLSSHIEVQLRIWTGYRQQLKACNGASGNLVVPTTDGLLFTSPASLETSMCFNGVASSAASAIVSLGGLLTPDSAEGSSPKEYQGVNCKVSGITRFPCKMLATPGSTARHQELNKISDCFTVCDELSSAESRTNLVQHTPPGPAQMQGRNCHIDMILQNSSCQNRNDISFILKDQMFEFAKGSTNSGLGTSENKCIQAAHSESKLCDFVQYQRSGGISELCVTERSQSENRYVSFESGGPASIAWNKNASDLQLNGFSLITNWAHPSEAVSVQSQEIHDPRNLSTGKSLGYEVHLGSPQFQRQHCCAPGMLQPISSANVCVNESGIRCYKNSDYPQHTEEFHFPQSQNQVNRNAQPLLLPNSHQLVLESDSKLNFVDTGVQVRQVICTKQELKERPGISHQQFIQENLGKQDEIHLNAVSKGGYFASQTASSSNTKEPSLSKDTCSSRVSNTSSHNMKKHLYSLFALFHGRSCTSLQGKCSYPKCAELKMLLTHRTRCRLPECPFPKCNYTKFLLTHFNQCKDLGCPVCSPVKTKIALQRKTTGTLSGVVDLQCHTSIASTAETYENVEPPPKRLKTENFYIATPQVDKILSSESSNNTSHAVETSRTTYEPCKLPLLVKQEITELKDGSLVDCKYDDPDLIVQRDSEIDNQITDRKQEITKHEIGTHETISEHVTLNALSVNRKVDCVSLTECFTPEQVRQHIASLRQWFGQGKLNKILAVEQPENQNSCQLCAAEELNFEPMHVYCTQCGSRIRRHAVYYMLGAGDTQYSFCTTCHNAIRGVNFEVYGKTVSKTLLEKKQNSAQTQEPWVQCDECKGWLHQICALFNNRMNGGGLAKYTCPNCYVVKIEKGNILPLPQSAFLGAKDLPRTLLSDHIEKRLLKRLKEERQQRAAALCLTYDEVPGAEALVVRVVLSVDKKLEVKNNFYEIFREYDYPAEFPYKSKVILLFQEIEGVEVCLFGMYVQEFGLECNFPNKGRIYISYLDSVKYFRPDVKVVTGEALRTFVYHELLIGYLDYCKNRGFTSCYIWACPPPKGEDYILYCHPEIQRTTKSDKLRKWYLAMLRKAAKENIVVGVSNFYDQFLLSTSESKVKITAARLPYFDGDYWPGAAEEKLQKYCQESDEASKKRAIKKLNTKRTLRASPQSDLSDSASKDVFLIQEIGKTISPMKEDFIMVHLQHACTHCCMFILSGNRWICKQCSNFQLCDKCHEAEKSREERDKHPVMQRNKHLLHPVEIVDVPSVLKEEDEIIESEILDTRYTYLRLCQGNHYQYDTLRRAKHSSMMLLYHLHNPTAPAFVTVCSICYRDIEAGQGFRCEVCFEYEVCNGCYKKDGGCDHPHTLMKSSAAHQAQTKEKTELRAKQLQKTNALLLHIPDCQMPSCTYLNCRKLKWLFRHGVKCTERILKGCAYCIKLWCILQIHSKACRDSKCRVPKCCDLKLLSRRQQQQSESQRMAAVSEMVRQRAAEIGCRS